MAANNEVSTSHSVRVSHCIVHAVSEMGEEGVRRVPMKYSDHNPVTFTLTLGDKSYLVMSWNIEQDCADPNALAFTKPLHSPHVVVQRTPTQ